jgi:hypothetical protein
LLPFLCLAYPKTPSVELLAVEPFDSLYGSHLLGELDKAKPFCTTGNAVERQSHLCHMAHFGKKSFKLLLRCIVAQIPNKNLGADNDLLVGRFRATTLSRCPTYFLLLYVYF